MSVRTALWLGCLAGACDSSTHCAENEFLDPASGSCLPWVPFDYPGQTSPSETYQGPWQIAEVDWACEGTGYIYAVRTDGWAASMALDIVLSASWDGSSSTTTLPSETHVMENVGFAEDGSWDEYELALTSTGLAGDYTPGSTTQFDCSVDGETELTWKATSADDKDIPLDCGIWGENATGLWNTALGLSCYCFDCP